MANKILTIDMITNEALRLLINNMVMGKLVNRQYSDYFAKAGGKIGKTLRIRKPTMFEAQDGRVIASDDDIQDYEEEYVDLTVKSAFVAIEFSTEEQKYSLDMFSSRVLEPAIVALINKMDKEILSLATQVPNVVGDETSGLNEASTILEAGVVLDNHGALRGSDMRSFVVSAAANAALVNGLKELFNNAKLVGDQYAKGVMADALGFSFYMDQNVSKHTNGTGVADTITVNGANQTGSALTVSGITGTLNAGDSFNIEGVYDVNPVSKETTGMLKDFKVVSVNSGKTGISVSPAIITDGPFQNVTASAANGAALVFEGSTSGAIFDQNLAFAKDAIALAIIDKGEPERPGAKAFTARSKEYNCAITIIQQYDIRTESTITKLLIDYAYGLVRPELAVVVKSKVGATK